MSADTPKGFPLALWKPSGHAIGIGGERLPLGVLECRPLLPSVARPTIQSILRGSLSPPLATMCMRKRNGETKDRRLWFPGRIFAHRLNTSRRGAAGVARRMGGLVGRATAGSSEQLSRTPRATPAVIPGKVGEGIANPFPKGALLAPRASGKPFGVSADTSLPRAPAGAIPCAPRARRQAKKEKWRKNFHSSSNIRRFIAHSLYSSSNAPVYS